MGYLFRNTQRVRATNTTYLFGDCSSAQMIRNYANSSTAVIAGEGTQHGSQNTYLLLQFLRQKESVQTWVNLSDKKNKF